MEMALTEKKTPLQLIISFSSPANCLHCKDEDSRKREKQKIVTKSGSQFNNVRRASSLVLVEKITMISGEDRFGTFTIMFTKLLILTNRPMGLKIPGHHIPQ
jgi:hypothetical protein